MPAARPSSTAGAMGEAADLAAPLLAAGLAAAAGWAVCLKFHLTPPDAMRFPLVGTFCGGGEAIRMGLGWTGPERAVT